MSVYNKGVDAFRHGQMDKLWQRLAAVEHKASNTKMRGYVKEVKEAGGEMKARCVIGIGPDGKEVLGPWQFCGGGNNNGAGLEQSRLEEGQNVDIHNDGGDLRQATLSPTAESKSHPQPSHGPKTNGRARETGKVWEASDKGHDGGTNHRTVAVMKEARQRQQHQDQPNAPMGQSSQQSGGQQQGGQQQEPEAAMVQRADEKGFLTGRVGNDDNAPRYAAHEKGSKIRADEAVYWIDKETKQTYVYPPPIVKKDGIPNDNGLWGKEKQGGGQQGSGGGTAQA